MRLWVVGLLTVLALAVGGGLGFLGGFLWTVLGAIRTDAQVACVLLQKAEAARYMTPDQRARLVDAVSPQLKRDPEVRESHQALRDIVRDWSESRRNHMKSGCPDA